MLGSFGLVWLTAPLGPTAAALDEEDDLCEWFRDTTTPMATPAATRPRRATMELTICACRAYWGMNTKKYACAHDDLRPAIARLLLLEPLTAAVRLVAVGTGLVDVAVGGPVTGHAGC